MCAPAPTTLGPPVRNGSTITVAGGLGTGAPRVAPPSARTSALARPSIERPEARSLIYESILALAAADSISEEERMMPAPPPQWQMSVG